MFSKNQYFFYKNGGFVENIMEKKVIFFLRFFHFLWQHWVRNEISCQRDIFFFLSISIGSKVIAFFVKKLPKLNILSVIAID